MRRSAHARIVLVIAAAALAGCGGGGSPGSAFAIPPTVYGGHGDQDSPALGDGRLAYVDYSLDSTGGCLNTQSDTDCAGRLVVVSLPDGKPLASLPVSEAFPALGHGFVVWTQPSDPRSTYGSVEMSNLDGTPAKTISAGSDVDATAPPAIDGMRVGWVEGNGKGPMVDDLSTGKVKGLNAEEPWDSGPIALGGGRAAFGDMRRTDYRYVVTLVDLATGHRRTFPLEDQTNYDRAVAITLTPNLLAWKEASPWGCYDPTSCAVRIVVVNLQDDKRTVLTAKTISRYGPVLVLGRRVAWLDDRDGPYALYAAPLSGGDAKRITPEGAQLPYVDPAAAADGRLAWAQHTGDDLDVAVAPLR